jgi:hypothetical protein
LVVRWIFPRAVVLPIVRHPIAAYRSLLDAGGNLWVEPRTSSAEVFAAHWNRLATSWIDAAKEFPFAMIRFEDLASGRYDFEALKRVTGLAIEPEKALAVKSGASSSGAKLSPATEAVIRRVARNGIRAYGYES